MRKSSQVTIAVIVFAASLSAVVAGAGEAPADAGRSENLAALPDGNHPPPLPAPWFPSPLHAVVFRNWGLVPPARLSKVLGATPAQIETLAESMGLPPCSPVDSKYDSHTYKTILRRNWHLLPYEQLLELTSLSADRLAFLLREDDFLWIKLGQSKPACQPVRYQAPNEEQKRRAAAIATLVRSVLTDSSNRPAESRYAFIDQLSRPPATAKPPRRAQSDGVRMIYAYFADFGDPLLKPAIDPYPDGLLGQWADSGINAIWMHVVLRQLAPGGPTFPEWGADADTRLANLKQLTERASRFGIKIYLYINEPRAMPNGFFQSRPELAGVREGDLTAVCTSDPRTVTWLRDSMEHVFKAVPKLGGVFTITASENLTNCASHGHRDQCPRCRSRTEAEIVAEVNSAIARGVHAANPTADVIAWDWGWNGHGDAGDVISRLPSDVSLMSVSEWALPTERGGVRNTVREYSISAVGPGPRATRHFKLARDRGLNVVAKMQANCSWELSSVPFLPTLDLVAEHAHNLARLGVNGVMLSWSLGGSPSPNLQVACRLIDDPQLEPRQALEDVARDRYGPAAAPAVRQAWSTFSKAFQEFPYDGGTLYTAPLQMGPANSLYAEPTHRRATMVGFPYDDLQAWRSVYPADVFISQMRKVADGWDVGVQKMQEALTSAGVVDANGSASPLTADVGLARAAGLHFRSTADQAAFVEARDRLIATPGDTAALRTLQAVLDSEERSARAMYSLASQDSRIGFEASNGYFYTPLDLVEKVVNVDYVRRTLGVSSAR